MSGKQYKTLSKRTVDRLVVNGRDAVFWDREIPGFGIRVYPSGAKVYVVQTRVSGKSRRMTIGRHGKISPDQARKEAVRLITDIRAGTPLSPEESVEPTVDDLAERYLREYVSMYTKESTARNYRHILKKTILPTMGNLAVSEVEPRDILSLQYGLSDTPAAANLARDVLKKMFDLAELWEMRPLGGNPCKSVRRYKESAGQERFLTPEELAQLGRTLDIAPGKGIASRHAAAAVRLLVLTGCRRNEILTLRWEDVDFDAEEFQLRDSKVGPRMVPMPPAAAEVLAELKAMSDSDGSVKPGKAGKGRIPDCVPGSPWVFPGMRPNTHMVNLNASWRRIREHAGLEGVRLHDLRHTYASRALALGEGLPMIGRLLGHRNVNATARYAHLARESIRFSTAKVAESIVGDVFDISASEKDQASAGQECDVGKASRNKEMEEAA